MDGKDLPELDREVIGEILGSVEEVVHVVDRDLNILYCNQEVAELARGKVNQATVAGRPLLEVFPFLRKRGLESEYAAVFEKGVKLVTREVNDYQGCRIFTRTIKVPVKDKDGQVCRVVTIIRETTAEYEAVQAREKLLRAVESAGVGICLLGPDRRCQYANRRMAEIFGLETPQGFIGRRMSEFVPPGLLEPLGRMMGESLQATGRWSGEITAVKDDGRTVFPALLSISVLPALEGEPMGFTGIVQDLSRERMMDEELLRKSEELASKGEELAKLNSDFNFFLSMTSHELRTPLTNIEGFSQLLEEKLEDLSPEERRDFVSRIIANTGRLRLLMEDLLAFSREKRRDAEFAMVDLTGLLGEVMGHLAKDIESCGAEIRLELESREAWADRQKLFGALKNLLENAMTYRREGVRPQITVKTSPRGADLLFVVSDNGPGIQEQEKEVVFEIFRRGSAAKGRPGSGVGLALVRENVTRMGGRAWAECSPGGGARFLFTLPAAPDRA